MSRKRTIALIAHDNCKPAMVDWGRTNLAKLKKFRLISTGTTGRRIEKELGLKVTKFKSGPLGGDQQIGAKIAEEKVDLLVFFWDPMSPHSHDVDVKALLRIAVVYNVPMACNQASADLMIRQMKP